MLILNIEQKWLLKYILGRYNARLVKKTGTMACLDYFYPISSNFEKFTLVRASTPPLA